MTFHTTHTEPHIEKFHYKRSQNSYKTSYTTHPEPYITPWLEWMDLQGLLRRQKSFHKNFDAFFEMVIQEHTEKNKDDNATNKDFMDVIRGMMEKNDMKIKITRDNIKVVIFVSP